MELSNEFRVSVPVDQAWAVLTDLERIAPCMPGAELQEVEGDEYRGIVKIKVGPITAQYKGKASFIELDQSAHRAVLRAEGRDTRGQGNASATVRAELDADGDGTAVRILTDLAITGKVAQFGRGVLADVSGKLLDQFVTRLEADVLAGAGAPATSAAEPAGSRKAAKADTSPAATPAPETAPTIESVTPETEPTVSDVEPAISDAEPKAEPVVIAAPAAVTPSANGSSGGVRTIESRPADPVNLLDAAGGSVAKRLVPAGLGLLLLLILWRTLRRG